MALSKYLYAKFALPFVSTVGFIYESEHIFAKPHASLGFPIP